MMADPHSSSNSSFFQYIFIVNINSITCIALGGKTAELSWKMYFMGVEGLLCKLMIKYNFKIR